MKTEVILKRYVILEAWWPNSLLNFYISEDKPYEGSNRRWKKPAPESMVHGLRYQDRENWEFFLGIHKKYSIIVFPICKMSGNIL